MSGFSLYFGICYGVASTLVNYGNTGCAGAHSSAVLAIMTSSSIESYFIGLTVQESAYWVDFVRSGGSGTQFFSSDNSATITVGDPRLCPNSYVHTVKPGNSHRYTIYSPINSTHRCYASDRSSQNYMSLCQYTP